MAKRPPAAQTAFGPMTTVAIEQCFPRKERLIQDDLAIQFLPGHYRPLVQACRWRGLRSFMIRSVEKRAPGIWGIVATRKRFFDDQVRASLDAGVKAVVNLGCGMDTRVYRLVVPPGIPSFEVDQPANIADKKQRLLALYGGVPKHVTLVPIDFQTQDLGETLARHGFQNDEPTLFLWEAVTQYLTEEGVRKTLGFLARAAPGSRLAFTFIRRDFMDGMNRYASESIYQEFRVKTQLWRFGLNPDAVQGFLQQYGWTEVEQVGSAELQARYVAPTGRNISVSEIERCVYAEKR